MSKLQSIACDKAGFPDSNSELKHTYLTIDKMFAFCYREV